jgi:hypothetical protein
MGRRMREVYLKHDNKKYLVIERTDYGYDYAWANKLSEVTNLYLKSKASASDMRDYLVNTKLTGVHLSPIKLIKIKGVGYEKDI